jgi:hypothetical protein
MRLLDLLAQMMINIFMVVGSTDPEPPAARSSQPCGPQPAQVQPRRATLSLGMRGAEWHGKNKAPSLNRLVGTCSIPRERHGGGRIM